MACVRYSTVITSLLQKMILSRSRVSPSFRRSFCTSTLSLGSTGSSFDGLLLDSLIVMVDLRLGTRQVTWKKDDPPSEQQSEYGYNLLRYSDIMQDFNIQRRVSSIDLRFGGMSSFESFAQLRKS
eukprot:scaffold35433_cov23-Cyclotella_meneghiniana.AAC.1